MTFSPADGNSEIHARAEELLRHDLNNIHRRTDRLFAGLMVLQWLACITAALWISPRTWAGAWSAPHIHVWAALLLGGAISSLPVLLALLRPGEVLTRHVIAAAQMLTSALLIHLTGGRIETHFHVFGSLALLAAYRDWRVLLTSTVVIALDHAVRGAFWPESVYGVLTAAPWRSLEHAGWVVFEDVFLMVTIRQSITEMRNIARQRAMLDATNRLTEEKVRERTSELQRAEGRLRLTIDKLKQYATQLESSNRDLTQTKAELEQKNRELDEFTYVASHDLQEPVRKLVSFSKLLEQDAGENLNEQARRDLGFIVDAADRMRRLVQDLLTLSRAGRAAMKSERVCLDDCRLDAMAALEMRIEETGAKLTWDELPAVLGDGTMLTQLYQNLIGNALKFTENSPAVSLTVEDDGERWILGVKDNGIGMKPEHADRIFKPFQRLHRRDQYAGTGIGLAICKKTVDRHGGRLWVESQPGEGAHFKFTLPKMPENKPCPNTDEAPEKELLSC